MSARRAYLLLLGSALLLSCSRSRPAIRNVLLISIDTLRADRLSAYGFPRPTTPNIDAVAREGVLFRNVHTPVPMTLPAHVSMLTGTLPPTHGLRDNLLNRLPDASLTLAEMLKPRGFTTDAEGRIVVDVHQAVRDRTGTVITDQMVQHVYVIDSGLIRRMEIRK